MNAFINSINSISPQNTFSGEGLLNNIREYDETRWLKCIEPQYNEFLEPMISRRMSRIIKMGVCSALKCLREAGIDNPDAIIAGTGQGCLEDTEKFLESVYENEENYLNPTPFIQSTHNTVSSAIALILKCNSYNNTYAHRGFAFENALLDGMMYLQENPGTNVLVGAIEEITQNSLTITDRLGFWKKEPVNNLRLLDYKSKGTIAGEGVSFFVLSDHKTPGTIAKLVSVNTIFKPADRSEIEKRITDIINTAIGDIANIDLIITGRSGDMYSDEVYSTLSDTIFKTNATAYFKHLCGEYDTCSSFALYLASVIIREQYVPQVICLGDKPIREIKNILIYNHLRNVNHSLIILSSC